MTRTSKRKGQLIRARAAAVLLVTGLISGWGVATAGPPPGARDKVAPQPWTVVSVEMPVSNENFPPGPGADVADGQCLICHSAAMVLRQPPLTKEEWRAEIMKMIAAYGALLPVDQADALSAYLQSINGR